MFKEPYEVLDVSGCPGPRLSRLTRISHPLLKNYAINCAEPFISVSKTDLEVRISGNYIMYLHAISSSSH